MLSREFTSMDLFGHERISYDLPINYKPVKSDFFKPERIFLAKGSTATENRRRFVESIISLYPSAKIIECPKIPHNQVSLDEMNEVDRHSAGKKTLVFGEHKSAVRFSDEEGNTCPNYWHFSPYGFCPFGCKYCYLAGTLGVWHSPTVKIFINIEEIIAQIDKTANKLSAPTAFYVGKLQDGLALDPLTGYSTVFVPFFAQHEFARQVILTKSDSVENLLKQDHNGNTIVTWSLNPPEISEKFEENVPTIERRLDAMKKCAAAGYPVRAVIMPVIPVENWEDLYSRFVKRLVAEIPLERLTIGGICIYRNARHLMENKIGATNCISGDIDKSTESEDGRARYYSETRRKMYRLISDTAHQAKPKTQVALCLEEPDVWDELCLTKNLGRCNCVL
jgi:spore photoproduct lyase